MTKKKDRQETFHPQEENLPTPKDKPTKEMIKFTRKRRRGSNTTTEETPSVVADTTAVETHAAVSPQTQETSTDIQMPTATQEPEQSRVPSPADVDKMTIAQLIKRKHSLIEAEKKERKESHV